ncbi:MAG: hypothetical protein JSR37_07180 [Verrucomicrobia bacterium]|nr:hypothetical protein [Verrucomicrobiota bacterium]MBS0637089.1 hypothetical protein [Verrucomicrobiota bacterium]
MISAATSVESTINWQELKKSYDVWRGQLFETTEKVLKEAAATFSDLTSLNQIGVYHKLNPEYGKRILEKYKVSKEIPQEWPYLGKWIGIWCALFDPHNTYSITSDLFVMQITFKEGYRIFDSQNPDHCKLWETWESAHADKPNEWKDAKNDKGESMQVRAAGFSLGGLTLSPKIPPHVEFYRENKFGCAVGYSDYMALMILLPECVQHVEQVAIP